jgi:hypothetical protein
MSTATMEPVGQLRDIIVSRISKNDEENLRLRKALESLQYLPRDMVPEDMLLDMAKADFFKQEAEETPSIVDAVKRIVGDKLKDHLIAIAREHGTVSFANLPKIFQAKGWWPSDSTESDNKDLITRSIELVRTTFKAFERPSKNYFRLATDNGQPATHEARSLNKKPLIEYAYDALKKSSNGQRKLQDISEYALNHGYVTKATTPMSSILSTLMSQDSRFVNVSRGIWRLRVNV